MVDPIKRVQTVPPPSGGAVPKNIARINPRIFESGFNLSARPAAISRILLVDDDNMVLRATPRLLRLVHPGFELFSLWVRGGDRFDDIVKEVIQNQPDLVLIDHNFSSGYSGSDVTEKLRESGFGAFIIGMTGGGFQPNALESNRARFALGGADHVIFKPLNRDILAGLFSIKPEGAPASVLPPALPVSLRTEALYAQMISKTGLIEYLDAGRPRQIRKIYVIDNNSHQLLCTRETLADLTGLEITTRLIKPEDTQAEVIEAIMKSSSDLVITDYDYDRGESFSGMSVTKALREQEKYQGYIFGVTGHHTDIMLQFIQTGADHALQKPVSKETWRKLFEIGPA